MYTTCVFNIVANIVAQGCRIDFEFKGCPGPPMGIDRFFTSNDTIWIYHTMTLLFSACSLRRQAFI